MVRNWRVRSLSHSLHVKERKSVIHLWVLSAVQLSCHSSQLSDSEFVLCLRRRGRGGGDEERGDEGEGRGEESTWAYPLFTLPSRNKGMMRVNWGPHKWSTNATTALQQSCPSASTQWGKRAGHGYTHHNSNTQRLGQKTESATCRLGQHMWVGYEVEAGGSRDEDVGISQD